MFYQGKSQFYKEDSNSKNAQAKKNVASETIVNYETVTSMANEDAIVDRYFTYQSDKEKMNGVSECLKLSLVYGIASSTIFFFHYPLFLVFANNVENGASYNNLYTAINAAVWGCLILGNTTLNAPEFGKGIEAASKILYIEGLSKEGTVESQHVDGNEVLTPDIADGDIEFCGVYFRYPSSAGGKWILRNFCLKINRGECIGIVGESGCGKSTILQLLYRFYEPQRGYITISGIPIKNFSISSLRQQFGMVQQEPRLFNMSIMENILYGKPHASSREVKLAAEMANATEFIEKESLIETTDFGNDFAQINEDPKYEQLHRGYRMI